jgi:D-lyxose ketol-isomerase
MDHTGALQPDARTFKRSQINKIIREAKQFLEEYRFTLPVWANWSVADWQKQFQQDPDSLSEILDGELGWDLTDFGRGNFDSFGLVLFTVRNGILASKLEQASQTAPRGYTLVHPPKTYCEKVMICRPHQQTPMHFHWNKMEDIICRGGAPLIVKLYNADRRDEGKFLDTEVKVSVDGLIKTVPAGGLLVLHPGESVTLPPYVYHSFWSEAGPTLIGEVSLVNDDNTDNRFYEAIGRFPVIEEDEPIQQLLTKDYAKVLKVN